MRYSSAIIALAAPLVAYAAPARFYGKRAASDVLVFKFADVLEQLESTFYQQAIAKFKDTDFTSAGFPSSQIPIEQFTSIQADEASHSSALQAALKSFGETPITSCQFNFDSALTDVATMAATARVVETVGVAAYLGGATLLTDPVLLTAAGSILTVEARHQTILNVLSSGGTAIPAAFDMAFTPSEVLAIASPFISGCQIPIPANPTLSVTNTGTVAPGTLLTFKADSLNGTIPDSSLFCQMLVGGAPMSIPLPLSQCVVPAGINGPVALFITSDGQPLINNVRDRATNKLVAGPTLAFVDTKPQMLGQIARSSSGSGSNAQSSTSTQTISPAEASSIISSANGAATATAAAASASSTSASVSGTSGGPNTFVGKSPDGKITVKGWTGL
ncbi:putative ferritin-like domain containing protein [Lyophyllum shimeji]|uniref:Ferritin-like domain containing protein n=1 Tax=Lyophyllum shimeji TaxID=47721 RepID=A0A9P3PCI3_LYOSH|nr:putative ferritin-like domain containing protein [Lyophyllum shimeji]